jgi:PPOX class probable F420-dependent enzyme
MAKLTGEQAKLFKEPNVGVIATIREDGTPQVTPVWVDWDGENVLVNTAEGRAKPRNIRRDPRVTVWVGDRSDPYNWVSVTGRAEIETSEEADVVAHIDQLAKKYMGRDEYGVAPDEHRLIIRVTPERVRSMRG